jgi:long-chain fatty acid transport protein
MGGTRALPTTIVLLLLALPDQALANNGLNLIGFSAEGVGMGGADVAVARDALSLGINPAGLSQLDGPRFDGLAAVAYADTSHRDEFAGWVGNENKVLYLGNLGLAAPLPKLGLTLGAGLFAQAGSGVEYHNLETAFGTRDDLSSIFRIGKAALGAALKIDDRLSIGVSPVVFAADLEQRLFPNTSVAGAGASFFGLKIDGLKAFAAGAQVGALYRITDRLALAAAYSTGSDLDLQDTPVGMQILCSAMDRMFLWRERSALVLARRPMRHIYMLNIWCM